MPPSAAIFDIFLPMLMMFTAAMAHALRDVLPLMAKAIDAMICAGGYCYELDIRHTRYIWRAIARIRHAMLMVALHFSPPDAIRRHVSIRCRRSPDYFAASAAAAAIRAITICRAAQHGRHVARCYAMASPYDIDAAAIDTAATPAEMLLDIDCCCCDVGHAAAIYGGHDYAVARRLRYAMITLPLRSMPLCVPIRHAITPPPRLSFSTGALRQRRARICAGI